MHFALHCDQGKTIQFVTNIFPEMTETKISQPIQIFCWTMIIIFSHTQNMAKLTILVCVCKIRSLHHWWWLNKYYTSIYRHLSVIHFGQNGHWHQKKKKKKTEINITSLNWKMKFPNIFGESSHHRYRSLCLQSINLIIDQFVCLTKIFTNYCCLSFYIIFCLNGN